MMKKLAVSFALVLGLAACGKDGNKCDSLAKKICSGQDDAACKATRKWIDEQLEGKSGSDEGQLVCGMVMDDKDALEGWTEQAKSQLGGEKK